MTREKLITVILNDINDWSCPDNYKCDLLDGEKFERGCLECAEDLLAEYETGILREFGIKVYEKSKANPRKSVANIMAEILKKWRMHHEIRIKYFKGQEEITKLPQGDWIDLKANEDITMKAGEFRLIPLGVAMELPKDTKRTLPQGHQHSKPGESFRQTA